MKKQERLFYLIKSLSPTEKRYFTLQCTRESSVSKYLLLFREIDRQESYDEAALRERLAGERFLRQLHVAKNYLFRMILKVLRQYHDRTSKAVEVKNILINVEILYKKELFDICRDELDRGLKIASRFELAAEEVEIHEWKRRLLQRFAPHSFHEFRRAVEDQHAAITLLDNLNNYRRLIIELSRNVRDGDRTSVPDEHLLADVQNARSLEAVILHYNARYFRLLQEGESKAAEDTMKDLIGRLENSPERIEATPEMYVSTVNNLISFHVFNHHHDKALEMIRRTRAFYDRLRVRRDNMPLLKEVLRTYNIELEVYRDSKMFVDQPDIIDRIQQFVEDNARNVPRDYLISFWFQLSSIRFMQDRFDDALALVNNIIQDRWDTVRTDLQLYARYLNLMIHLEKQNIFVLRYFVDGTRRFINKIKDPDEFDRVLIRFFSRISKVPVLEYRGEFRRAYDKLFPDSGQDLMPPGAQDYIDFRAWFQKKKG